MGNLLRSSLLTPFVIVIQKISHDINIKNKIFFRELNTEHLCVSLCVYVCACGWIGRREFSHHCLRVQFHEKKGDKFCILMINMISRHSFIKTNSCHLIL